MAAGVELRRPLFLEGVRLVVAFGIGKLGPACFRRQCSVRELLRASISVSTSRMAVRVGARRPVADVNAIFTSSSVPTFSPMSRIT
eukprot:660836-Pleurochrysis_carterae.AAC.1